MNRLVRIFLALVAVNAAIGSAVLLVGGMDGSGGKVFATSLLATLGIVVAAACATGWRRRARRPVAASGVVATAIAFGLAEAAIWWSIDSDRLGKLAGSAVIVSAASAATSLLGLATLAPRHRWVAAAADAVAGVVVGMALVAVWGDVGADWYFRVLGVLCVALASLAIVIPVLHRVFRTETRQRELDTEAAAFCPHCGGISAARAGIVARCPACGRSYVVRFVDSGARVEAAVDEPRHAVRVR